MDVDPPPPPRPASSAAVLPPISSIVQGQQEPPQTAVPPHPQQQAEQPGAPASQAPPPRPASSAPNPSPVPGPALAPQRASSTQPWPATALTPGPGTPAIPGPPAAESIPGAEALAPGTPGPAPGDQSGASSPSGAYRPLNVKDALSYLEMVKIKFQERPDVYNQFLDIMKDFKSQTIDTPGVIERVSTLFNGHPSLIQGFNTFLPQGYRIECSEGDDSTNTITVTTPTGIHTQTADGIIQRTRSFVPTPVQTPGVAQPSGYFPPGPPGAPQPTSSPYPHGPPPGPGAPPAPFNDPVPPAVGTPMGPALGLPQQLPHAVSPRPIHSPHPTTPGVATVLGGLQHPNGPPVITGPLVPPPPPPQPHAPVIAQDSKRPVEFNHAINYVNKIKNRFASDPDTYKQFLEILQTYQKEQRPIQSVYEQVAVLFDGSTDLLDEFKQFLPDTTATALEGAMGTGGGLFGMIGQMTTGTPGQGHPSLPPHGKAAGSKDRRPPPPGPPAPNQVGRPPNGLDAAAAAAARKTKKRPAEKEPPPPPPPVPTTRAPPHPNHMPAPNGVPGPSKAKKPKHHHNKTEPQSPPYHPPNSPSLRDGYIPPASDEAAFFDKVKKYIEDRNVYNDFLKLLHLFTEEIIDMRTLIERASNFLGGPDGELMVTFKSILPWDERVIIDGEMGPNGPLPSNVRGTVAVVPTIERPRVDLNSCRKYGPSYRKLPKHETQLACSGRDAMCWEVLNDEWVSHPTWASEDAGFSTHKKNQYEDAMHKSEEERHEYDFHIEAISRTIAILEPLNTRINHMDNEERAAWKLKPGLGGQGKSIYQRIIKKVYGREHGLDVIQALHESPSVAIPVILHRLKQKEEEWKRAQREWNKVWREVDARNFYKSLDHQGINFKNTDKKNVNSKQLVQDIEAKKREMDIERAKSVDPAFARTVPKHQYAYEIADVAVLQDSLKLVFSFLDRAPSNSAMSHDARQIETFLRTFIPLFFCLDEEEFNAPFPPISSHNPANGIGQANGHGEDVTESEADDAMAVDDDGSSATASNSKKKRGGDLRKKVLKGAAAGKKGGNSGKKSASSSRRVSPAPAPPAPATSAALPGDSMHVDDDANDKGKGKNIVRPSTRLQDNVWIRHGLQEDVDVIMNGSSPAKKGAASTSATRKGTFFANNTFYVLLRNLQLLYTRLNSAKKHAMELASVPSPGSQTAPLPEDPVGPGQLNHPPLPHAYLANPLALRMGLADAVGPGASRLINSGPNPASQFYEHLLECCEQLFDAEMDQSTFEDHMRFMFGIRAYHLFTIDKVVGSVIKQVQAVLSDVKNKELLTLLRRERTSAKPFSIQEQINARRTAEHMIGPEENLYRVTWLPDTKVLQIQLLARDDASTDDAETMTERWKQYMASYVLRHQTEGLPAPVAPPLLHRTLLQLGVDKPEENEANEEPQEGKDAKEKGAAAEKQAKSKPKRSTPDATLLNFRYGSRSGVEIKVCIRTYRIFFEAGGEDWFYRKRSKAEATELESKCEAREKERTERWKTWHERRLDEMKPSAVKTLAAEAEVEASVEPPAEPEAAPAAEPEVKGDVDMAEVA
ncbi:Transcriptional regulatory protein sin3 [Tulasnella sp. UAMH 9824]|nr:Transcriptional regulatory protein sin3 [Tulasnella sp. UAMH 9824]